MHTHSIDREEKFESGSLGRRIAQTLDARANTLILGDVTHAWTGSDIARKIDALLPFIHNATLPGSYVAISYPNSATKALLIIAVIAAGRIPVLISFGELCQAPDTWLKRVPTRLLLTAPSAVSSQIHHLDVAIVAPNCNVQNYHARDVAFEGRDRAICSANAVTPPKEVGLVLFTSGSTGKAKGILIPEDGLLRTVDHLIEYFSLDERTVSPIVLPVCHSMALNTQFLPTFFAGGRSHFVQSDMSFHRVYRSILEERGTFIAMITAVLGFSWQEKVRHGLPAAEHVEHVQLAGGSITERHLQMASELFPNAVIHKGYGLTEATRVSMISARDSNFHSPSVGQPLPFLDVQIRASNGRCVESGQSGEIHVRGASVLRGYIDGSRAPLTLDGYLPTGDFGYTNGDGELCVVGRADDLMKINGHRISGFDIEKRAMESSELIAAAKCMAFEDGERLGQKIVLFLEIPSAAASLASEALSDLQKRLWDNFRPLRYRPKEILVFDRFPRTASGKISLEGLRALSTSTHNHQKLVNPVSKTAFFHVTSQNQSEGIYA